MNVTIFRSCQLQQLHSLMIDVDAESIARGDAHIFSSFTENANDVRVNACCLTKELQSLLWNEVGYDFKVIE